MAGSIAKAYVQVIPSAQGIKGKLSGMLGGEASAAGDSAGGSFASGLISKAKGLIASAGIGKILADAIMGGSELEQLKGGVQKIFDEMDTSKIMADAANAYKDFNMSADKYLSKINDVGAAFAATMGDEKGYSVAKTGLQAIADYASGTGKDVAALSEKFTMITRSTSSYQSIADQFSGILPATSANFLEQAQAAGFLSGEYKALTEVPIAEYQDAVSQMLKKGTAELGLAGNTAAETATTFAGSLAAMKASYSNFLGTLATGEDVGPSLNALGETVYTFLVGNLLPMVGNILASLPEVLSNALSMAVRGLNIAANNADAILQMGTDFVIGIGTSIITAAPYLLEAAFNLVTAFGTAIVTTDWAQLANDTITNLRGSLDIAAGEILGTDGDIVGSMLSAINAGLPDILAKGGEMVANLVTGVFGALPSLVESALSLCVSFVGMIVSHLPTILSTGKTVLMSVVEGIRMNLPQVLASAGEAVGTMLQGIIQNLPNILVAGVELVYSLIAGIWDAAPDLQQGAYQLMDNVWKSICNIDWPQLGRDIINGLIRGLSAMGNALWSAAQSVAKMALNAIKRSLGIASPSKVMRDQVGKWIPSGVAVGIKANTKPLTDAMHNVAAMTTDTMQTDLRVANTIRSWPAVSVGSTPMGVGSSAGMETVLAVLTDLAEGTAARQSMEISLLRELIQSVLNIEVGDDTLGRAVERYNRKKAVLTGAF